MRLISRSKKILSLLFVFLLLFTLASCDKKEEAVSEEVAQPVLPDELRVLRDNLTLLASNEAEKLSGNAFSTAFLDMIRSGSGTSYKEFSNLKATLDQIALSYNAYQVYLLTDMDNDITSLEVAVASNANRQLPICSWGEHHKAEYAVSSAYNGVAEADMFARTWENTVTTGSGENKTETIEQILTWTAYAPILDTDGSVACVFCFEYPETELLAKYPEWNRMDSSWNGITEPIE